MLDIATTLPFPLGNYLVNSEVITSGAITLTRKLSVQSLRFNDLLEQLRITPEQWINIERGFLSSFITSHASWISLSILKSDFTHSDPQILGLVLDKRIKSLPSAEAFNAVLNPIPEDAPVITMLEEFIKKLEECQILDLLFFSIYEVKAFCFKIGTDSHPTISTGRSLYFHIRVFCFLQSFDLLG